MRKIGSVLLMIAAVMVAVVPLLSQTASKRPAFDVVSIRPSAPLAGGAVRIGGGARGNRYTMAAATLRMLLQQAYQQPSTVGPSGLLQIIGGPSWIESDRYDIQATVDCAGGVITRDQLQLMIRSMLEDRFQLKAHMETRELPIYNLVAAKDGAKLKLAADQTPPPVPGGPTPCSPGVGAATPPPPPPPPPAPGQRRSLSDPDFVPPRGSLSISMGPTSITVAAGAAPLTTIVNLLQQQIGRPVINKTDLKGLFDFKLTFSPEGLAQPGFTGLLPPPGAGPVGPGGPGITPTPTAADPVPSLFTAIQELGLRLESSKGPVEVLVVDSVEKPTEN